MTAGRIEPLRLVVEIGAIVFGILLAFSVDAWYDSVRENERERDYENRIAAELRELKSEIEAIDLGVRRSQEYAETVALFFSDGPDLVDQNQLVLALYNTGRDYLAPLDTNTYEDIVSTGNLALISDTTRRESIRRAYAIVRRLEDSRFPSRDLYLAGVRGWIPQRVVEQIRDACPNISRSEEFICSAIDLDDEISAEIVASVLTDQGRLAFQVRHQGLDVLARTAQNALEAVDEALGHLE